MLKLLLKIFAAAMLGVAVANGAEEVPLLGKERAGSADVAVELLAARNALAVGLPTVAAEGFDRVLKTGVLKGAVRNEAVLDLVSARLNEGKIGLAEEALGQFEGRGNAEWFLRSGLVSARKGRWVEAKAALEDSKLEELPAGDAGWWWFLQGILLENSGDLKGALAAFEKANGAAVSELQRASFLVAREQAQLLSGKVTEAQAADLLASVERYRGRSLSYVYAKQYAVALAGLGRGKEAEVFLQRQLQGLPAGEAMVRDDFRLLLGLIAGVESGVGRVAVEDLLASGRSREVRQMALVLLERGSASEAGRRALKERLDVLIGRGAGSLVLDDLLLVRARLALDEKDFARTESAAKELLEKVPGSRLKAGALELLADVAWELKRYRLTADYALQARAELKGGGTRVLLGVLVAEAYFLAGDYSAAAEAYAMALLEVKDEVPAGLLMGQEVLAKIMAGALDEAGVLLDRFAGDRRFETEDRWVAEWHLARALQGAGRVRDAFERVNKVLPAMGAGVMPELRVRMGWLQAHLSLEAEEPAKTVELAKKLVKDAGAVVDKKLRGEVEASARLLEARAMLRLEKPETALGLLKSLRQDFPQSDAAIYSYINEADYYAEKKRFVDAQALLTQLADEFKGSDFAPHALYLAAVNAERRGQDVYYKEAYRILERIEKEYNQSDFVFAARLRQGDLLRKLNQFGPAQQVYEFLINNYPQHPGVLVATLSLAACHRAQATGADVSHYESALAILERLNDLPDVSSDVRAEAGFQLGDLLMQKPGGVVKAQEVWWGLVNRLLLDEKAAEGLGVKGRYWVARTLLKLGDSLAEAGKLEEARTAYRMVLDRGLPFENFARESLSRAGG